MLTPTHTSSVSWWHELPCEGVPNAVWPPQLCVPTKYHQRLHLLAARNVAMQLHAMACRVGVCDACPVILIVTLCSSSMSSHSERSLIYDACPAVLQL